MIKKFIYLCLGIFVSGCTLNIPPADQYSDPYAITDVKSARALLTSAYMLYPHYEFEMSVLGNDFCLSSLINYNIDLKNLYLWREDKITQTAEVLWLSYYNTIATCDVLLERMDNVITSSVKEEKEKASVYAEVKTLRALCYFNLLRLFSPAYDINPNADGIIIKNGVGLEFPGRSSIKACTEFIRNELKEIASIPHSSQANGWLSQEAVSYLQAEIELYTGNFPQAAGFAENVLKNATPALYQQNEKLWQKESFDGRIFAFYHSGSYYTDLQYQEKKGDYFVVNPQHQFQNTDSRRAYTLYPFVIDNEERMLFGKYNKNNKEGNETFYINVMRYAGALFIAAEAYSRTQGMEEKGRKLVNDYLQLCGATPISQSVTGVELTKAILTEKHKEFLGEGVNYLDLKRNHNFPLDRFSLWGNTVSSSIPANDYRWTFPIPRSEYRYNENVTQNEGWPGPVKP